MIRRVGFKIRFLWIAGFAALLIGLLLAVHWSLPYWVNTRGVHELLMSRIAAAYSGDATFNRIKPALLPLPHAVVTDLRLTKGDHTMVEIPKAAIHFKAWPLTAGQLEIDRIKLFEPDVRLDVGLFDGGVSEEKGARAGGPSFSGSLRPLAAIVGPLGEMAAEVVGGHFELRRSGRPVATLSSFTSFVRSAEGVVILDGQGKTDLADGFKLTAEMDVSTGYGRGQINVEGLHSRFLEAFGPDGGGDSIKTSVDLDLAVDLFEFERLHARFSARSPAVEIGLGDRQLTIDTLAMSGRATWTPQGIQISLHRFRTASPALDWTGSLEWTPSSFRRRMPIRLSLQGANLQIDPIRKALIELFHGHPTVDTVLEIVRGGRIPSVNVDLSASDWASFSKMSHLQVEGRLAEGRIVVPGNRFDLEQVSGRVGIANGRLTAYGIKARQNNTVARHGVLTLGLYDGSRAFTLDTIIDADAAELPMILKKAGHSEKAALNLERFPPVSGRVSGRLTLGDRLDRLSAKVTAKARLRTDASAIDLVGRMDHRNGDVISVGLFAKGRIGQPVLNWLARLGDVPATILPAAPFSITGADILLDSSGNGRLYGVAEWDNGPFVGGGLSFSRRDVLLHRLQIRDAVSDALISIEKRQDGRYLDARFSGRLDKSTLDRLLENHRVRSGSVKGHLQLHLDREDHSRTVLKGALAVRDLEYPFRKLGAIRVVKGGVKGHGRRVNVSATPVKWEKSTFSLEGRAAVTRKAIDIHGKIIADRLNSHNLMAAIGPPETAEMDSPGTEIKRSHPLRGKISVEIGEVVHDRYRFAPLHTKIDFGEGRTVFDITDAALCGIRLPGRIIWSKGAARLDFSPRASRSDIQDLGACLVDRRSSERVAGMMDLEGRLTTKGRTRNEFFTNLKGGVDFTIEKGRISNVGSAGFFTNLLSYLSVNQYVEGDLPDLRKDEFLYNRIESKWIFDNGRVQVREGSLKSNSVNMVADGHYELLSKEMDMVVLISPLTTVDWIVERIPILGNILQGTLVAIPVRVKGPDTNPAVLPLSPKAVGARLGGILKRTVRTPVRIIEPLLKDKPGQHSEQNP